MKKTMLALLLAALLVSVTSAQTSFSFMTEGSGSLGKNIGFDLGFQLGNAMALFFGASGRLMSASLDADGEYWLRSYLNTSITNGILQKAMTADIAGKVNILSITPTAGLRIFMPTKGAVTPYLFCNAFKAVTVVSATLDGEAVLYNENGSIAEKASLSYFNGILTINETVFNADGTKTNYSYTQDIETELKTLTDLFSVYGGSIGLGATYAFANGFELYGEFGAQLVLNGASYDKELPIQDGTLVISKATINSTLSTALGVTKSVVGIRFRY